MYEVLVHLAKAHSWKKVFSTTDFMEALEIFIEKSGDRKIITEKKDGMYQRTLAVMRNGRLYYR